jgi:hypothetical protein
MQFVAWQPPRLLSRLSPIPLFAVWQRLVKRVAFVPKTVSATQQHFAKPSDAGISCETQFG